MASRAWIVGLGLAVLACGDEPVRRPPADAGFLRLDAAVRDAAPIDLGAPDAPEPAPDADGVDADGLDAGALDVDLPPGDAALLDAAPIDAAPLDAATIDAALLDAAPIDANADVGPTPDADGAGDAGPAADAAPTDAATDGGLAEGPARYDPARLHSPVTPAVVARWQAIAAAAPTRADDVFAKVGDSITVSTSFLHCFAGSFVDVDGRAELLPTIAHFAAGDAAGTSPFTRVSEAATVGWSARAAIAGSPSPLDDELGRVDPRFAVVMFGTNDVGYLDLDSFGGSYWTLVERTVALGVVPILSTIPPRDDDAAANAKVPSFNAFIRGIAELEQAPLVDYHQALLPLPGHGLAGDGVHPNTYRSAAGARPCNLGPAALEFGYNVRNLLTITALDRAKRALVDAEPPPDPPEPERRRGAGTFADPIVVPTLPYADRRNTLTDGTRAVSAYPACDNGQNEAGPELVYRFELQAPSVVWVGLVDRGDTDVDLHLLDARGTAEGCLARGHQRLEAALDAGTYHVVADTFVSGNRELGGDYVLLITAEPQ